MKDIVSQLDHVKALLSTISQSSYDSGNTSSITRVQQQLSKLLQEAALHDSPTWAAHMTSSLTTESLAGIVLSHLHNGNLLSAPLYPELKNIEIEVLSWIKQLFHQQYGHFVAGGSYANLEALWQAKQAAQIKSGYVYCSTSVHYSIVKACQILDLNLVLLPTDEYDRLDISALHKACKEHSPIAIVATLGTTSTGAIDPIADCIQLAKAYNAWCHIDAAWGGLASILPETQALFNQLRDVDSVSFDPHKGWGQPKPSSLLMYQHQQPFVSDVSYLEQDPSMNLPGTQGGESFLPLWLMLSVNEQSIHQHVSHLFLQAKQFETTLKKLTNWIVLPADTAIVCFQPPTNIDLTPLIEQQVFSTVLFKGNRLYRAVFAQRSVNAEQLIAKLKAYF